MPEIVVLLVRLGFLALLWLFVLSAVQVVRSDLFGTPVRTRRTRAVSPRRTPRAPRLTRRSSARTLVVTQGPLTGTTVTLGATPVTIGRSEQSTLVLSDDYASTHHARLVPTEGAWLVEDLGSTNGTYLDRDKVTDPRPVPIGTPIRIGRTTLELRS